MKKPKAPRLVTITIITTATIIFWIFFEVYRIFTTTAPVDVPEEILRPINPTLDSSTLQDIERRVFFESGEIPEVPTVPSPESPPELETTPAPSPAPIGAELPVETSPTPTATESAETE